MNDLYLLVILLIAEYVGDFLLQSRTVALNKSSDIRYLFMHLQCIFFCLLVPLIPMFGPDPKTNINILAFVYFYCLIHGIQDWFVWRIYKKIVIHRLGFTGMDLEHPPIKKKLERFKYWEDKLFYDFIGLDRLLHILTMVLLYGALFLGD